MGWEYTDEQQGVMDEAGNYGHQYNPFRDKNDRDVANFWGTNRKEGGFNPKGKLTDDFESMTVDAGVAREQAVSNTWEATPMGMGGATGSLMAGRAAMARTAGDDALTRGKSDAYVQGGINKTAEAQAQFNAGESRYLASLGIKANVANNPHETVPFWKQLAMFSVGLVKDVAAAAMAGGGGGIPGAADASAPSSVGGHYGFGGSEPWA